ncbi:MAG: type II secretion system F family protein [Planctomycetota bacterium]|jgi:type IV pilus assembly protein PilC
MDNSQNQTGSAVMQRRQQSDEKRTSKQQRTTAAPQPNDTEEKSTLEKIQNFRIDLGPSTKDILHFTNQLAVMIRAGISLQDSLESISEQISNQKFKGIVINLKERIESGESFSQALSAHSDTFSHIYINMVAAAEISGALSDMLQKLSEYLNQEAETRSQVKGAMVYPAIIAFMAISVTIFLLCYVLPKFCSIFAGKEDLLPIPTKILMGSSAFLRGNWFYIVLCVAAVIWAFIYFIHTEVGRYWWDKTKLVLPIIKKLCRNLYITRGLHTMSVLVHAGVPILDTLSITAEVSGNVLYKRMWQGVHGEVRQGKKIAPSLRPYNLMPTDVIQMIRSGEDSGTMGTVLREVGEYYNKELRAIIKVVTSMIEPIMIVLMGILVGFIAMSIMLPIFKMSNLVTGK